MEEDAMKTNILSPVLAFASLILLAAQGCSLGTVIPGQATEPPTPTTAPSPTPTTAPSPTPVPSPTPNFAATRSAQATQEAAARENEIKSILDGFDIPSDTGHLLWDQTEPVAISLTGPEREYKTFADNIVASDFVIQTDVTWDTNSWPVCGVFFRSDSDFKNGAQYRFLFLRFSGLPAWDIEYHKYDRFVFNVTVQVKFSSNLDLEDGATNQFLIMANDKEFTVYINGIRQGRYFDDSKKLSEGYFAFYASQDGKETTCTFADTWIWSLK
jgi:hypothetical protein